MDQKFTNRLIHETSPYLLQHSHNPVDWYPWGEEALERARKENKPLLISIGYSACHWCHVMERESFEDESVAAFMNEHFINIKIDREERPDLDHIYMDAVQSISGSGGWPLNVFCTPDTKPFFGGTYFPSQRAYRRISWMELLSNIHQAWEQDPQSLKDQSQNLFEHIRKLSMKPVADSLGDETSIHQMRERLMSSADLQQGGFGMAPKFPQTMSIRFLLAYGKLYKHPASVDHALRSLRCMYRGGIYDQLGGGLCRYSTDDTWLVPHFEKMLYDNALLLSVLSDAYKLTRDQEWEKAIHDTWFFLRCDMKAPEGGYYAAIDADSEGEEGKFYVWTYQELLDVLGEDAADFCSYYQVTENGNWEGKNILHREVHAGYSSAKAETAIDMRRIQQMRTKLLKKRNERVSPQKDDKIILGWNSLLLSAACHCYAATGDETYKSEAIELYRFMSEAFFHNMDAGHVVQQGRLKHPAFLDDLAFFIQSCIHLQEMMGEGEFLKKALALTEHVCEKYRLTEGIFSYTALSQDDVLFSRPEIYDGATPSGNSIMAGNLLYLSKIFPNETWEKMADRLFSHVWQEMLKFPGSFSNWCLFYMCNKLNNKQIHSFGPQKNLFHQQILREFIPGAVLGMDWVEGGIFGGKISETPSGSGIYLCMDQHCLPPVDSVKKLMDLIK